MFTCAKILNEYVRGDIYRAGGATGELCALMYLHSTIQVVSSFRQMLYSVNPMSSALKPLARFVRANLLSYELSAGTN
jgi:hypothetical protein